MTPLGHTIEVAQANCSQSFRGVLRGIHFADVPPGQAKYVTCVSGSVLDAVVYLRVGSPGYGRWAAVPLNDETRCAVFVAEGLGHSFMTLSDKATVLYLCSTPYAPGREHGASARPRPRIAWPEGVPVILSEKDAAAPSLEEASPRRAAAPSTATALSMRRALSMRSACSGVDLHPAVIAEYQPVRPGHGRRRCHLNVVADQGGLDPPDPAEPKRREAGSSTRSRCPRRRIPRPPT